jgi:hypothetical protein
MNAASVIPLLGIVTNVALFLYLAGRMDKLTDAVYSLGDRVTRLEERISHVLEGDAKI